ncbi:hypothetical protein HYD91_03425 [Mycoplasmopsis bovis]|nr:hypothetical protein [Mycoplasmopsis bovis]QQH35724.1 hypothetical protein HYD91_03425 [Mycoplasmopsis bovis]
MIYYSTLFTDYNDGENDNKNKVDELFKKTKSKLEKAYKKKYLNSNNICNKFVCVHLEHNNVL